MESKTPRIPNVHGEVHVGAGASAIHGGPPGGAPFCDVRETLLRTSSEAVNGGVVLGNMAGAPKSPRNDNFDGGQAVSEDLGSKIESIPSRLSNTYDERGSSPTEKRVRSESPDIGSGHFYGVLDGTTHFGHGTVGSGGPRPTGSSLEDHGATGEKHEGVSTVHSVVKTPNLSDGRTHPSPNRSGTPEATVPGFQLQRRKRTQSRSELDKRDADFCQRGLGTEKYSERRTPTHGAEWGRPTGHTTVLAAFGHQHADEIPELGRSGKDLPRPDAKCPGDDGPLTDSDDDGEAVHHLVAQSCEAEGQGKFRLFAKRPTRVATKEDQHLPLHVQLPPVPYLSWKFADEIMTLAANPCDEETWFQTSAVYRSEEEAYKIFQQRAQELDVTSEASLFGSDLEMLLQSKFAIKTGMSVEQYRRQHCDVAFVKIFAAIELRNDAKRRRVIGWPRSLNQAEKHKKDLLESRLGKVRFYSATEIRNNGVAYAYAASLDFKKFYQQFELLVKKFWAFIVEGEVFLLSTIPTGAVFPPLFAQALSRTMLALAVRTAGVQNLVQHDCCIDNLRLCSNNAAALWAAWHELLVLCDRLGATIGEKNPPPLDTMQPYTYLGMLFTSEENVPRTELALKSKKKLKNYVTALSEEKEMLVVDVIAIFGQTVWASIVTGFPLGKLYHVLKFIRRLSKRKMNDKVTVWPSIIDLWRNSMIEMSTMQYQARPRPFKTATMYTDACETGWGVVILGYGDRPIRIFAGRWTPEEMKLSINVLELRALRIGVRILASLKASFEVLGLTAFIDNTSARAWALRRRAPKWAANELAMEIHEQLQESGIVLEHLEYVESARNLADAPSRKFVPDQVN